MHLIRRKKARHTWTLLAVVGTISIALVLLNLTRLSCFSVRPLKQTTDLTSTVDWSERIYNKSISLRLIYIATESFTPFGRTKFDHCQYKNCYVKDYEPHTWYENAHLVIFDVIMTPHTIPDYIPWQQRQNQIWIAFGMESPGYPQHQWRSDMVDGKFNGTMTYRSDSTLYYPYGRYLPLPDHRQDNSIVNYAAGKSKGAFAYVSNCNARYPRLDTIKEIGKYIDVDLFGKCSGVQPCSWANFTCEEMLHTKYRFYIGLENSLCKDYLSEKVFNRLSSNSLVVPIAMGGLSVEEYEKVLPSNSFLHIYNFSNIEALGKYLQNLMTDDAAYNRYHHWRGKYIRETYRLSNASACELCEMANVKPSRSALPDLSSWWNNDTCRTYEVK